YVGLRVGARHSRRSPNRGEVGRPSAAQDPRAGVPHRRTLFDRVDRARRSGRVSRGAMKIPIVLRSGGQSGVDRAALCLAVARGIPYAGWCPRGGWAEDFSEPPGLLTKYPHLTETPSADPAVRTEWNVRDGHATLVVAQNGVASSPGTRYTIACAQR